MGVGITDSTEDSFSMRLNPMSTYSTVVFNCIYNLGRSGVIVPSLEEKYKYIVC